MDILEYINRMNRLYGTEPLAPWDKPEVPWDEQQVAGLSESFPGTFTSYNDAVSDGFQGTREEWLQQQSIPQIERPLTGAQGGRVYDTRQYFKPGGIVEPGVTHYATKTNAVEFYNKLVAKAFEKKNLSKVPAWDNFVINKYGDEAASVKEFFRNRNIKPVNLSDEKIKLIKVLKKEWNDGLTYRSPLELKSRVKKMDVRGKVPLRRDDPSQVLANRILEAMEGLDSKEIKIKKAFNSIRKNNEVLRIPKREFTGAMEKASIIKKMITDKIGFSTDTITMNKGLSLVKGYEKNIKQFNWMGQQGAKQLNGMTFDEAFDLANKRIGGGMSWKFGEITALNPNPKNTVMDWALRHFDQTSGWGEESKIKFFDKKGDPITWKSGKKLNRSQVYFTYEGSPIKWGLTAPGKNFKGQFGNIVDEYVTRKHGTFNNVFAAHKEHYTMMNTKVTHPNTGKKVTFGELMTDVYKKGFGYKRGRPFAIDHRFGIANDPFNNLRSVSKRTNLALRDMHQYVPQKGLALKLEKELLANYVDPKTGRGLTGVDRRTALIKEQIGVAEDVLVKRKKFPLSGYQEIGGKFLEPSKFKTLTKPEQKIVQQMAKADTYKIFKSYQNNGIGPNCKIGGKAEGGRIGFAAGGYDQCMNNAIQEHNEKLKKGDLGARTKQFKINQTKNMKNILGLGLKGGRGLAGVIGGWGGAAIEVAVEGGFYEWARRKGLTHEQALEETFFTKLLPEDVQKGMFGYETQTGLLEGAEPLLEKELYQLKGTEKENLGKVIGERGTVKRYIENEKALAAARNKLEQISTAHRIASTGKERDPEKAERLMTAGENLWKEIKGLEKQLNFDRDNYQAAVEKQQTVQGVRGIEYGEFGTGDTPELARRREEERYRAMEEKFPGYSKAQIDEKLEAAGLYIDPNLRGYKGQTVQRPEGLKFLKGVDYGYASDYFKNLDKQAYFAENFRLEKAGGGRIPFGRAGSVDKARREFMKWFAGVTGATIAAGTGLIKFGKVTGTGKTVIKAGDHIIQGTEGMPHWFIPLVNRITKEGTDVTKTLSTIEREIVHTKSISKTEDVTVYQNLDTGNVRIEYGGPEFDKTGKIIRASNDPEVVHLEYKAPEEITSGEHAGKKTKSEFSAAESEPEVVNWEGDIEWSGDNVVGNVDDLITDTSKLKQFATKKKPTMKEIVESQKKQKYQQKLEKDQMEQIDYIEKKGGATIDDIVEEEARVSGMAHKRELSPDTKLMNLPKEHDEKVMKEFLEKTKKASGGRVDYDTYLPDIDDLD
jgi:hypothetical protein